VEGWPPSPAIHEAAFRALGLPWRSVAVDGPAGRAAAALAAVAALDVRGLSVTMPLKEEVAGLVDELEAVAARLGSVNCVTPAGDRWVGASTDGAGFVDALADAGVSPAGRRWLVLGAGGAARAVVLALAEIGAVDVAVLARRPERAAAAAALAGVRGRVVEPAEADVDVAAADVVVNATPLGMAGVLAGRVALDPALLSASQVVVDLVYEPLETPLLTAARAKGATAVDGLGILVHQAAHALRRWTGQEPPVAAMAAAAHSAIATSAGA
jgi:shikimate dehydrogenase